MNYDFNGKIIVPTGEMSNLVYCYFIDTSGEKYIYHGQVKGRADKRFFLLEEKETHIIRLKTLEEIKKFDFFKTHADYAFALKELGIEIDYDEDPKPIESGSWKPIDPFQMKGDL